MRTLRLSVVLFTLVVSTLATAGSFDLISVSRDFLYNPKSGELFVIENKIGRTVIGVDLKPGIPRESFKEIYIFNDAKHKRYLGLRVQEKEILVSKKPDGTWAARLAFVDRSAIPSDALPKKVTMLVSERLATIIVTRSRTYDQDASWYVNEQYVDEDKLKPLKELVNSFTRQVDRVKTPTLELFEDFVRKHQPSIYQALSNKYELALAKVIAAQSAQKPELDTTKIDQEVAKPEARVDSNKSLSPEVAPDFNIHNSTYLGKGRRPGPLYPLALPDRAQDTDTDAAKVSNQASSTPAPAATPEPPQRKTIYVKGAEGKPVDAWSLIDSVTDDLRKIAEGKPYLEDPDLRQLEDRILRNLLKPQGGGMKLLGPAGAGKSFLLERLAMRFAKGDVPAELRGYQILQTSAIQLQAGTMYVGTIDATINAMIEVSKQHQVLWIIDEAHALKDAGTHSKRSSNVLQGFLPGMAQGYLKFLLASTPDNWSAAFESDTAFDRRLDRVDLVEANREQLLLRLKNWMNRYQLPSISDTVLERVIFYSGEFAIEGSQLSKATALLNEIASFKSMKSDRSEISLNDVSAAVKELYNVDPAELETERKIERYKKLQASFENLVGQAEAKEAILRNTRQVFAGVVDRNKPRQRVLLAGLKGQGKTEMVKLFAEAMGLPSDNRLVMSEYSTPHDVNKMKERIAQLVRRSPFTVLFFDEIEKAHPDVQKSLLGILDSATMTYSVNESAPIKISLKNTSIFMATNAGSDFIMKNSQSSQKVKLGFINDESSSTREISQNQFRQALIADGINEYLLDRMNIVTPFKILTKDEFKKVLEIHFQKGIREIERNSQAQVDIRNLPELVQTLGEKMYFPGISNREVERIVNDELRQKVADVVFETGSQKVVLDWQNGQLQPAMTCEGIFLK